MTVNVTSVDRLNGVNEGVALKAPVRVASTGTDLASVINVGGLITLDGVALAAGDRVLLKDQTDQTQNGIYTASTGPWTRTVDADGNRDLVRGSAVAVTDGTLNAQTTWQLVAVNPVIVGQSTLQWVLENIGEAPADGTLYGRENHSWQRAVPLAGGTMTGPLVLSADPTTALGAATKEYVDAHGGGGGTGSRYWKDIKIDFGAVGDGVTSDDSAFLAFTQWAMTQTGTVFLVIPPGTYVLGQAGIGPSQPRRGGDFYRGIKSLIIWAYGATLTGFGRLSPYGTSPPIGGTGAGVALPTARINLVSAGATTVTLKSGQTIAGLGVNVGDWVTVASSEKMGDLGAPPTWEYFEFAKISVLTPGVSPALDQITFVDPLMFTHLDTYPATTNPSHPAGQADPGGPATVFVMTQDWDQKVTIMGMNFPTTTFGIEYSFCCRIGEMIDCSLPFGGGTSTSNADMSATVAQQITYRRCSLGDIFVPDKDIGILKFVDCKIGFIKMTTTAYEKLIIDGCHVANLGGFAKNTEIVNSNIISLYLQTWGIGLANTAIIDNCTVGSLQSYSATSGGYLLLSNLSFANGRFSMAKSIGYSTYANVFMMINPGRCYFFALRGAQRYNFGNPFLVLAIGDDGTNIWFDTTLAALPAYTSPLGIPDIIVPHPCGRFSARGISGDPQALQFSKAPPETPLYSYIHKVYGADLAYPAVPLTAWGTLVSLTVNVIIADTGPNTGLLLNPCGQYGAYRVDGTNTVASYNPHIDLKTAGKRVITPTAVTGSVGLDNVGPAPGPIWFMGTSGTAGAPVWPFLNNPVAGQTAVQMPLVEIELITDQGITKLAYNPLGHN